MRHDAVTVATHSCLTEVAKSSLLLPIGETQLYSLDLRRIHTIWTNAKIPKTERTSGNFAPDVNLIQEESVNP